MRNISVLCCVLALTPSGGLEAQDMRTVTMSRRLVDHEEISVAVRYGTGRFSVHSLDEGLLYRMSVTYDEDAYEPVADFSGTTLELGLESLASRRIRIPRRGSEGRLALELARNVPMRLDLEFGAVRADIDLGGLELAALDLSTGASESSFDVSSPNRGEMERARFQVGAAEFVAQHLGNLNAERIEVDAGVGSLTLGLDGDWRRDASLSIQMGLGALELRVPEGLGLRLRRQSLFASVDAEGLVKRGDTYSSLDWDEAERRVTIDLDAAFGSVEVVWVR